MGKYNIPLTKEERDVLREIIHKGKHTSQKFRNAYILLNCDRGEYGEPITNEQNSEFVAHMEQVLDIYKKPYDERFPVVCMDESAKQLNGSPGTGDGKRKTSPGGL